MGARIRHARLTAVGIAALAAAVLAAGASAFAVSEYPPPPDGVVGIPYKHVFEPVEGAPPYAFYFKAGDLPPGLKIDLDGTFSGTPTQAGIFNFDVEGTQYCGCPSQRSFTVKIRDRLAITTASLRSATVGQPYSAPVSVVGNGGLGMAWSISAGSLPAGMSIGAAGTPADTTISGTPTTVGTSTFTIKVGDTDGYVPDRSVTRQYTLAVVALLTTAAAAPAPTGIVGRPYRASPVTASGGLAPLTWGVSSGSLPPGVTVEPATGGLTGTPTAAGSYSFTVGARDADGRTAGTDVTVAVVGALDLATTTLRRGKVGKPYRAKLRATGGAAPLQWKVTRGKLPAGLRLNARSGEVTGSPKAVGTTSFTATVTDSLGQRSSEQLSLTVRA